MTLKEMKEKTLRLIEEISPNNQLLTDDPDISSKINDVINQIQNELSRMKKISARQELEVKVGDTYDLTELDKRFYQLNIITGVKNYVIGNTAMFYEDGTAKIFYYRYPKQITHDTEDTYKFELSTDVLEIMPYGVAGDLLKSDISAQYGQVYSNRYNELKQQLDPRYHTGSIYIEGGIDEFI